MGNMNSAGTDGTNGTTGTYVSCEATGSKAINGSTRSLGRCLIRPRRPIRLSVVAVIHRRATPLLRVRVHIQRDKGFGQQVALGFGSGILSFAQSTSSPVSSKLGSPRYRFANHLANPLPNAINTLPETLMLNSPCFEDANHTDPLMSRVKSITRNEPA